jgi:hypothetical protein
LLYLKDEKNELENLSKIEKFKSKKTSDEILHATRTQQRLTTVYRDDDDGRTVLFFLQKPEDDFIIQFSSSFIY